MHRSLLIAATALIATSAYAADPYASTGSLKDAPAPVPAGWSGFYVGVNGGYGQGSSSRDVGVTVNAVDSYGGVPYSNFTATGTATGPDTSGGLYGAQLGYLLQPGSGSFVIGAEFAFNGSSISGDKTSIATFNETATYAGDPTEYKSTYTTGVTTHQQLDYLGTLTGVVGMSFGSWMPYVKGGLAFGEVQNAINIDGISASDRNTATGWTAGGGVAWNVAPNWRLSWEWDYYDLGSKSLAYAYTNSYGNGDFSSSEAISAKSASINQDFWATKFGASYVIPSSYIPLK